MFVPGQGRREAAYLKVWGRPRTPPRGEQRGPTAQRCVSAEPLLLVLRLLVVGAGRADAGDDGLLRALVQALASAPDRAEELVEVDLERREDAVGPVLH